jgi:Mrp family chromosome partitioning ATPase
MFDARAERETPGLLASAWRYRWMTLLIVFQAALLGFASTAFLPEDPPVANASMALADPRSSTVLRVSGGASGDLKRYTANRAEFVRSSRVLAEASRLLDGRYRPDQLASLVSADVLDNTDVIRVSATGRTRDDAVDIADAVTTAYSNISAQDTKMAAEAALDVVNSRIREIRRSISAGASSGPRGAAAAQTLAALEAQASQVSTFAALFGSGVVFTNPAKAVGSANRGPSTRNGVLGALVGFLIAMAVAWMRADRDQRIDDAEDAADLLGAPLFGDIPDLGRREERTKLQDITRMPVESYQFATTALRLGLRSGVVLVVSADWHDGRTTTAANVAAGAAREGLRIALVDGDSRNQGLSRLIGVEVGHLGLTDVAAGRADLNSCIIPVRLGEGPLLSVVPAGRFHDGVPSDFRSRQMSATLAALSEVHDLVVVDCPPLLKVPDASALAGHADGVLAVVRAGSAVSRLQALRQQLDLLPARLVGYVVTRPRRSRDVEVRRAATVDVVDSMPSPH